MFGLFKRGKRGSKDMKEAAFYEKKQDGNVQCFLCPHHCVITPGKEGLCQVRRNVEGTLISLNYGKASSVHLDPVEKKPLYHFYPGKQILSLGTLGCNLSCSFCQNWSISQIPVNKIDKYFDRTTEDLTPAGVGAMAAKFTKDNSVGIAWTYNEPSIWFEFILDSAKEVKKLGLKNVLVSNGYMEKEPLMELLPYIDAINLDIKSMDDIFYKKLCGARLKPVLEYAKIAKKNCLLEITNLIVTGENDSPEHLQSLVDFIADELGKDTPIHFSRYHPDFQFDAPATPVETLELAFRIASEKLDYVYVGNVWYGSWDSTLCPSCKKIIIDRSGYKLNAMNIRDGSQCGFCGGNVAVVGEFPNGDGDK